MSISYRIRIATILILNIFQYVFLFYLNIALPFQIILL